MTRTIYQCRDVANQLGVQILAVKSRRFAMIMNHTESQNDVQHAFDMALRQHCEFAGKVLHRDWNGLTICDPATGSRLTVKYEADRISLHQTNWGDSYMVYVPCDERMKLRVTSYPNLRDAYHAAKYVMERFLNDEKL
jgi:hypothetical protein